MNVMTNDDDTWLEPRPVYNNSHFDEGGNRTLRIGSMYGARSFLAHPDGSLSGITYKKAWTPGANEAECWRLTGWNVPSIGIVPYRPGMRYEDTPTGRTVTRPVMGVPTPVPETTRRFLGWEWQLGDEKGLTKHEPTPVYGNQGDGGHNLAECSCGFHSYWRGSLDYAQDRRSVNAIIRAWGVVRRGDRGMRSQYAEIVALYIPDESRARGPKPAGTAPLRDGFAHASRPQPAALVEAISAHYPAVPIYTDLDDMLALHDTEAPS